MRFNFTFVGRFGYPKGTNQRYGKKANCIEGGAQALVRERERKREREREREKEREKRREVWVGGL